ncbi:tRNA-dependent cyclodipeptide synthase [Allokutzneria albata]|uniref:Cyclodipeptide synthase n=1 Tax=Allokutzneria albata TaxID=211114 RepID=A0A1G9SCZ1_ALLAB|nr:tRNA-dependent cyclodipeptide synthase [Allokutzneria albata]SDM33180.1 cyclo(L-tyrosyl-L-tyrosyl) synthase [Allokutzneria albata]
MLLPTPLTEHCAAPLRSGQHVCVGVSPFNSYFSVERITDAARWAMSEFEDYHFFIPDRAAAYTLEALGYEPDRARLKARRQGQYVVNKVCRALWGLGATNPEEHVLDGATLAENACYQRLLAYAHDLFTADEVFTAHCLDATRWVLDRRLPEGQVPTDEQLRCAVRYFLAELPLFVDTPAITGVESSVFAYHQRVKFLELLYSRELPWRPHPRQGFVLLRAEEDGEC